MFKRGGIYQVNPGDAAGGAQESRPCLVVSNNISNEFAPVITVIPLLFANLDKQFEFEILLPASRTGLTKDAKLSALVILTIDKTRITGERIGFVNKNLMERIEKTLFLQLDLKSCGPDAKESYTNRLARKGVSA